MMENRQLRVCVVGAGTHFLSGISYYTLRLVNALARSHKVSVVLMRQLLPTHFYPGRMRVGANLTRLEYDPAVQVFDGVDWYWLPSMLRALVFLIQARPDVVVFQWWSGTVLHSYLLLALVTRLLGARVVIEFHEVLDTGEAKLRLAQAYVRLVAPLVARLAHGFVIHSEYDRNLLQEHYDLEKRPVALIPHGPYDHYQLTDGEKEHRTAPISCCNFLFFGVIRPYKGLEDLIRAFDALPEDEIAKYWLTIVGETWEQWTIPTNLINQSRYRDRITFVNRYVSDAEVAQFFTGADAVVMPYHRASTSGPLHIAMSYGLPIVVTRVGGLIEAVTGYEGAILVPPEDIAALQSALPQAAQLRGKRYTDTHSWEHTIKNYRLLFNAIHPSQLTG
ncbi:MAG: glycosyltransferase family 4 protein [Ktedonobacteraceae bacterium]|nr:glycosyltransferase family 4 protein [Ktedonobacteraceae bacterium]